MDRDIYPVEYVERISRVFPVGSLQFQRKEQYPNRKKPQKPPAAHKAARPKLGEAGIGEHVDYKA